MTANEMYGFRKYHVLSMVKVLRKIIMRQEHILGYLGNSEKMQNLELKNIRGT